MGQILTHNVQALCSSNYTVVYFWTETNEKKSVCDCVYNDKLRNILNFKVIV